MNTGFALHCIELHCLVLHCIALFCLCVLCIALPCFALLLAAGLGKCRQACRQVGDREKPQAGHGTAHLNLELHQQHMMLSHMHVRAASMLQRSASSKVNPQIAAMMQLCFLAAMMQLWFLAATLFSLCNYDS